MLYWYWYIYIYIGNQASSKFELDNVWSIQRNVNISGGVKPPKADNSLHFNTSKSYYSRHGGGQKGNICNFLHWELAPMNISYKVGVLTVLQYYLQNLLPWQIENKFVNNSSSKITLSSISLCTMPINVCYWLDRLTKFKTYYDIDIKYCHFSFVNVCLLVNLWESIYYTCI
jgi:hypothetical protein